MGEMTLIVPDNYYNPSLFQPFNRIVTYRTLPDGSSYVDLQTPWFIVEGPTFDLDSEGQESIILGCVDAIGLILPWRSVAYNDYNGFTSKLDYADDMCKAILRENAGALATDTDRDLTGAMNIAPDHSSAPIIRLDGFARQPVLDVLHDICRASANDDTPTWLGFDVILADEIAGTLEFRTYIGQRGSDHRSPGGSPPVLLSVESGNLSNVKVGTNYKDSSSFIYAGGPGVAGIRAIATQQDDQLISLSPFGRREKFIDGSQLVDLEALTALAKSELRAARPRRTFEAQLVETSDSIRGVHWDWGDYLTASHRNLTYDVRVEKLAVRLTPGRGGGLIEESRALLRGDEIV